VKANAFDALLPKLMLPLYVAVMMCVPMVSALVL
jgi:hypothetical protein